MLASYSFARVVTLGAVLCSVATLGGSPRLIAHAALVAGPPWISIETPVNPYDASTRGAFLVVHAFHHGDPVAMPLSGTAEGIVNGERRTVALEFAPTTRAGTYALHKQWSDVGLWTLVITVTQHDNDIAQALVELGADGSVARVHVPTRVGERNMPIPRALSARDIDGALRQRALLHPTSR